METASSTWQLPNQGSETVSVLLGNGDGTFRQHVDYPCCRFLGWIGRADFNQDGKLDLDVAGNNSVGILLGNGDGTFQAPCPSPGNGPIHGILCQPTSTETAALILRTATGRRLPFLSFFNSQLRCRP